MVATDKLQRDVADQKTEITAQNTKIENLKNSIGEEVGKAFKANKKLTIGGIFIKIKEKFVSWASRYSSC